jgi:urease accessory protein
MSRPTAREIRRGPLDGPAADRVVLDYEGRFLRRRLLTTASGAEIFVDLPETVSLDDGDGFVTDTSALIGVAAAPEPLIEVTAPPHDLARLAWHIGNRHMPAAIEPDRILIQSNHVMADMLARLGATTRAVTEPFAPERGAYGTGRTHGHHRGGPTDHPHPEHDHGHGDGHDHGHDHGHHHGHGQHHGHDHDRPVRPD